MGRKTKLVRLNREHADRCAALAERLPGATMGDVIREAIDFHSLAFTSLAEAQRQAGREVSLDLSSEGLLRGFVQHVVAMGGEAVQPDPEAVRLAATMPGATAADVQRFAVDVFCRALQIIDAAGLAPDRPVSTSPDDVIAQLAEAFAALALRVEPQHRQPMEIQA